jgi:hypothetical protein
MKGARNRAPFSFGSMKPSAGLICPALRTSTAFWNATGKFVGSAECAGCHPAEQYVPRFGAWRYLSEPQGRYSSHSPSGTLYVHHHPLRQWRELQRPDGNDAVEFPLAHHGGQGQRCTACHKPAPSASRPVRPATCSASARPKRTTPSPTTGFASSNQSPTIRTDSYCPTRTAVLSSDFLPACTTVTRTT